MEILDYYKMTKEKHILLSFKGALSQEILVEMGNLIKSHLSLSKKIKKIFSVFVELSQNIMHYSSEKEIVNDKEVGVGIILFVDSADHFLILSGNLIEKNKVDSIKKRINHIKSLNPEELKEIYNEQIRNQRDPNSKGAGLGFIDICRKSNSNIDYEFYPIDSKNSFFSFIVKIAKED